MSGNSARKLSRALHHDSRHVLVYAAWLGDPVRSSSLDKVRDVILSGSQFSKIVTVTDVIELAKVDVNVVVKCLLKLGYLMLDTGDTYINSTWEYEPELRASAVRFLARRNDPYAQARDRLYSTPTVPAHREEPEAEPEPDPYPVEQLAADLGHTLPPRPEPSPIRSEFVHYSEPETKEPEPEPELTDAEVDEFITDLKRPDPVPLNLAALPADTTIGALLDSAAVLRMTVRAVLVPSGE